MTTAAGKHWLRLSYGRIPQQVGVFFEQLTLQITRGTGEENGDIDLQCWNLDAGIEVKGCDDTHAIRIPTQQLERHDEIASGFPFSRVLYFIYRYKNRRPDGKTGLSRTRGAANRSRFLLSAATDLWIVDHRLFMALERSGFWSRYGTLPLDPERKCLAIRITDFRRLFAENRGDFSAMTGLDPAKWRSESRMLNLELNGELSRVESSIQVQSLLPRDIDLDSLLRTNERIDIRLPDLRL